MFRYFGGILSNRHFSAALFFAGILFAGFIAGASERQVTVLGIGLPPLCTLKLLTGVDCPGCGITRSLIFAIHGEFYQSYLMHLWGVPLFVLIVLQIPLQVAKGLLKRDQFWRWPAVWKQWATRVVALSLVLPWTVKLVTSALILYLF